MPKEESEKTTVSFDKRALKLDERKDAHEIVKAITEHTCLETLILSGNTMGIEAGEAIGEALKTHYELRRALWSDMFTSRSKAVIAPALKNLTNGVILSNAKLYELDLRDNAFGPTGVVGVTDLLGSECCYTLKILRMDNEGLGHQGCKYVADALTKCLRDSQRDGTKLQLEVFTAGRNRLENEGVKMLSEVFFEMKSLQELTLFQNGIGIHGPDGCVALARALSENKDLRILNLSDNSLTSKGMKVLAARAFPNLDNLEVLNVSDCILRSSGAKCLANSLCATIPNLRELYVSGNEIRRDVAIELIFSLESKSETMETIDLNCNEFGEVGITDIYEAATSIDLQSCLLSMDDDEGCDDDEEDEGNGDDDEDYEEDEDEDDEEDSLEGDNKTPQPESQEKFTFKTPEPVKSRSLFEGLPLGTSGGGGLGSLFSNPALVGCKPNTSLFSSPSKSSDRIFGSGATVPTNVGIFGDVKSPPPSTTSSITGQHLFSNTGTQQKTSPEPRSLFDDPKKSTNAGLFGNTGNTGPSSKSTNGNGTDTSKNILFKIPDAVASQAAKNQKSSGSVFTTSGNGSAQLIQPAKLISAAPPNKTEINQMVSNFLRDSRKPQDESIKRLSALSMDDLKNYFLENPSLLESSVQKCVQCLDNDSSKAVGQSFLNATLMANPTETTNYLMVELDLIKGESRKKSRLSAAQVGALLASIKNAFTQKLIPAKEAKLLSFLLTEGPKRPNAQEIRQRHRGDIDNLVACIEKGIGNLKL